MKEFFKKSFIPSAQNNYKPHFWRAASLLSLFFIVILIFFGSTLQYFVLTKTDFLAAVFPRVLVDLANSDRSQYDMDSLSVNPILEKAAALKVADMTKKGYFAHKSPEGITPWYWFKVAGYDFAYAGENLAINFSDSVDVDRAWMNSPSHRANILNGNFTEIGIATAEGMYEGRPTIFVVEMFGQPAPLLTIAEKEISPSTSVVISSSTEEIASSSLNGTKGENELFVAVKGQETKTTTIIASEVLGRTTSAEKISAPQSTIFERLITNPGKVLKLSYSVIAFLFFIALILFIFIEIKKQHPKNIAVGLAFLLLIYFLIFIYQNIFSSGIVVL